jgi:hypothetical protein
MLMMGRSEEEAEETRAIIGYDKVKNNRLLREDAAM